MSICPKCCRKATQNKSQRKYTCVYHGFIRHMEVQSHPSAGITEVGKFTRRELMLLKLRVFFMRKEPKRVIKSPQANLNHLTTTTKKELY